ncbi:hypothetical protein H4R34_003274 [Dimargaris verticillata]|uniref:Calcium load-activated calcium channel n=1 Tax=Dimargaris verticillata TaxID=2761393 RepID=A0A9W8B0A9_9FUNG|nr:hypothetical protein H4R34_003274 [Dimargaris verticillata]
MISTALQVFLYALANAVLSELIGYHFVYKRDDYQSIKAGLERTTKRLAAEEANETNRSNQRKRQRRIDELKKQVQVYNGKASGKSMRLSLVTAALQIATFYYMSNYAFPNITVAKLPFTPFGFVQGLSHRGLDSDDYTDCSAAFLFLMASLFIRAFVQRYGNWSIRKASPFAQALEQAKEANL